MLCIPIICATAFYVVALFGAYNVGVYGALAVQRLLSGDHFVFVYCAVLATLSYFATKEFLSKCREAIRTVRRQLEDRRA